MEASARTIHTRAEFWRVSNRISVPPMVKSPGYETRLPVDDVQHTEGTVGRDQLLWAGRLIRMVRKSFTVAERYSGNFQPFVPAMLFHRQPNVVFGERL